MNPEIAILIAPMVEDGPHDARLWSVHDGREPDWWDVEALCHRNDGSGVIDVLAEAEGLPSPEAADHAAWAFHVAWPAGEIEELEGS